MKLNKIVIALSLAAAASSAFAANSGAPLNSQKWAQNIQGQVDGLSNDVAGVVFTDIPAIKKDVSNLKSENHDQWHAIAAADGKAQQALDTKVDKTIYENDKIRQLSVDTDQDNRLDALENAPKPKDGKDGVNGLDGKDGVNGLDGKDGKDGVNGLDGKDGKDGVNGLDGKDGLNGTNGIDGKDGKDGAKGDKGDTGLTGASGKDGINGVDGKDGAKGKDADMTLVNNMASGVTQLKADGAYAQSRIDAANQNIQANRDALDATNKRVAANSAKIADHESRIQSLESSTSSKFSQLNDKIEQNRKHASAGIAGVAAMANIPQVSQGATFSVGAGAGSYDGEQGLAVGFSGRIGGSVVTKASVSATTQNDFVFGVGISKEW